MKEELERGEYEVIISDEASARIPTLILRKVMKKLSPDQKNPETFFVSGGEQLLKANESEKQKLINFLKEKCQGKKTLVVTEFSSSGQTILELVDDLGAEFELYKKGSEYAGVSKDENLTKGKYKLHPHKIEDVVGNITPDDISDKKQKTREDIRLMVSNIVASIK